MPFKFIKWRAARFSKTFGLGPDRLIARAIDEGPLLRKTAPRLPMQVLQPLNPSWSGTVRVAAESLIAIAP